MAQTLQIYPYWNVNRNGVDISDIKNASSNLSILECKCFNWGDGVLEDKDFKSIHTGM